MNRKGHTSMKKTFLLLCLSAILLAATTYTQRSLNQSWKLDNASIGEELDPISGKWEVITAPKINMPVLTQSVKYADYPKVLFKDHDYYDFDVSTKLYISSE